jgi:hypothetical protein
MMKRADLLINGDKSLARAAMVYQILGQFGDRLSKDIQEELRTIAEVEEKESNHYMSKLRDSIIIPK